MKQLTFGQPVKFIGVLVRKNDWNIDEHSFGKKWINKPCIEKEGILIGKRTLYNGLTEHDPDVGTIFSPTEHFTAYLVAFNMKNKPVLVLPENLFP